jgi:hypothetical protein
LRQPVFQISPQAFDGIEFGGVRGKEQQPEIGRESQGAGFVKGAIIEQEEMEAGGIGGSKMVEEELKALGIEGGQCEKETLPGERFNRAVQVETLEAIGRRHDWLNAACCEPAAQNGQEPTPTFVLHPPSPLPIALLLRAGYTCLEVRAECRLKLDTGLGFFFGCERRGALSFALSL